jgi:exonuclease SbcC
MKLEKEQFSSADDFLKALLTDDQREDIQRRQKKLDEQQTSLNARNASIKENLLKLEEQNLTDKSEEELNQLNINRKTEYDSLLIDIGSKKAQLKTNEQRKKQYAQMHSQLEQQQAIAARWSNLNNIIGSADGKKYRRIVQKMSLEILIDYANDQMQVLAPRYQLTLRQSANDESDSEEKTKKAKSFPAGGKEELEIYCIDSWQSGAIRPTTNLSGGESFLVSLALALGLSKMSSRNRTLETLFLDEGFGSLDDATLQTALDAISQFQYSDETNKLVGIISHVDALKERIANKIEVSRTQAGVSALSGPGVTKEA